MRIESELEFFERVNDRLSRIDLDLAKARKAGSNSLRNGSILALMPAETKSGIFRIEKRR